MKEKKYIRNLEIQQDSNGRINRIGFVFGPHHFIDVSINEKNETNFVLGVTHHGFEADASILSSDLEKIIWAIRESTEVKVKKID
jgi:hypothetical protein